MKNSTKLKIAGIGLAGIQILEDLIGHMATGEMINWGLIELSPENLKEDFKRSAISHAISFGIAGSLYGTGIIISKIEKRDDDTEDVGKEILDAVNTIMPDTEANNASDSDKEA